MPFHSTSEKWKHKNVPEYLLEPESWSYDLIIKSHFSAPKLLVLSLCAWIAPMDVVGPNTQ